LLFLFDAFDREGLDPYLSPTSRSKGFSLAYHALTASMLSNGHLFLFAATAASQHARGGAPYFFV
jgi:hypothetical protein